MASRFSASEILELTECPVCIEKFSQTRTPKCLTCSHTVCVQCLCGTSKGQTQLLCPVCRGETIVPEGDVTKIPTNLMALQLAALRPISKCEGCRSESKNSKCFHCAKQICEKCLDKHTQYTEKEMNEMKDELEKHNMMIEHFRKQIDSKYLSLRSQTTRNVEEIHVTFRSLQDKLTQRRDSLIAEVITFQTAAEDDYNKLKEILSECKEKMSPKLNKIKASFPNVRQHLTKDILMNIRASFPQLQQYLKQNISGISITFTNVDIDTQSIVVQREIEKWGAVTSQRSDTLHYVTPKPSAAARAKVAEPSRPALPSISPNPLTRHTLGLASAVTPEVIKNKIPPSLQSPVNYSQKGRLVRRIQTWQCGGRHQEFAKPKGVAVDAVSGELFVADGLPHNQVHVFTLSGKYIRSFGGEGRSLGKCDLPYGVCINHNRDVIVCDFCNNQCQMLSLTGECIRQFGQRDSGEGALNGPVDVAVDDHDNMYVTSSDENCVKVYTKNGEYRRSFGSGQFEYPGYIQWSSGVCMVGDANGVQLWREEGEFISSIGASTDPEPLIVPRGVTADWNGNFLVLDVGDNTVKVYSTQGQFVTKFPVAERQSDRSHSCFITCTPEGTVIVADSKSKSVLFY